MNPLELFHFLTNLLRNEAEVIASFFVGVAITLVGAYTLRRWVLPQRDSDTELAKKDVEIHRKDAEIARKDAENAALARKLEAEERQAAELANSIETTRKKHLREKKQLREDIEQLNKQVQESGQNHTEMSSGAEALRAELEAARKALDLYKRKATTVVVSYKKQLAVQTDHVKAIEALEGRIWEAPPRAGATPFQPLEDRQAPIIAVTNLKGGVGKTSLTANLAAVFGQQGKKVLVVDLDHQASLTNLCLPLERIKDLARGDGKLLSNVFKARGDFARVAWNNLTHLDDAGSCLLAASEELADVEEHAKAQWLIQPDAFDMRYLLRSALHDPLIQNRFDMVLLDCPPRWTPASINALAACDFVLIPVLLDRTSAEAVPRLLAWLHSLKAKQVCAEMSILGVVGNRAWRKDKLSTRERGVWKTLRDNCADAWQGPVHLFERFVPTNARFADAADERTFAALDVTLYPIFEELIAEIEQRRAQHDESRGVATVS